MKHTLFRKLFYGSIVASMLFAILAIIFIVAGCKTAAITSGILVALGELTTIVSLIIALPNDREC